MPFFTLARLDASMIVQGKITPSREKCKCLIFAQDLKSNPIAGARDPEVDISLREAL
jgi:hypothetical protein